MAKSKPVIDPREVGKILRSPAVAADLRRRANNIAAAAGPGFLASVVVGRTRARGSVITTDERSRRAEATTRALTRALDAGRN